MDMHSHGNFDFFTSVYTEIVATDEITVSIEVVEQDDVNKPHGGVHAQ